MLLRRANVVNVGAVIAIHGQREWPVEVDAAIRGLVLEFDDTEALNPSDPLQAARLLARQRDTARMGLRLCPPKAEHARAIVAFASRVRDIDDTLLCHCRGGVSRSPAAALLCLATWTSPGQERYCIERLLAARSCAIPHRDLVRFGDE